jgi:alpha-L-fucosidase
MLMKTVCRNLTVASAVLSGVLTTNSLIAQDATAHKPQGRPDETKQQRDARMAWWREARFGMFIHWGLYAVPAGTTNDGRKIEGIGEWIMLRGKIPVAEYAAYAKQFNPTKYDPDAWVRLAKDAGMKYIVITSKHHDGFALFDSKATDYDVVDATPYGKDLLKPLAEACRKHGMKLGFYYSQAQDWHHPGGAAARGGHWDPAQDGDMDAYIKNIAAPQVREILTNYGDVAVLWWDTPVDMNEQRANQLLPLLKLQPNIIVNNRLGAGISGDTETPEQFIPSTGYPGRDFEVCMTMNDTWGFKSYDENWKSPQTLLRNLIDIASKGGNYLLNVGPTAQGEIPQPSIERLRQIGAWMKDNGDAIYGTAASPFKKYSFDGRATRRGNALYLHVFSWPGDSIQVTGLTSKVSRVHALRGGALLQHDTGGDDRGLPRLTIRKPAEIDPIATVLVVDCEGEPTVDPSTFAIRADASGVLRLSAAEAFLMGRRLKLENGGVGSNANVGGWTDRRDFVMWDVLVPKAGDYNVELTYACPDGAAGSEVALSLGENGDAKASTKITGTGDADQYERRKATATLALPQGVHTLSLRPTTVPSAIAAPLAATAPTTSPNNVIMKLKEVRLTPKR